MSVITCGNIHQGHEWFRGDSEEDEICMCLTALLCEQWRCQAIDQVLLHEIIFFVSVHSTAVKC